MVHKMKTILPMSIFLLSRIPCARALLSPATVRHSAATLRTATRRQWMTATAPLADQQTSSPSSQRSAPEDHRLVNLSAITLAELESLITSWGHKRFRAAQIWQWIHDQGVVDVEQMHNIPKAIRQQLLEYTKPSSLELILEQESKDGTIKRAYKCFDGQIIESVLMPYRDGRYTACISSQAGCAQGCVFCATGQMGLARQLTSDEIFEQVARFSRELIRRDKLQQKEETESLTTKQTVKNGHGRATRLSNVVFMGMGEPLANYRHVVRAIERITGELGIGARKITVSTVGIVPNIKKLMREPFQVRLAVSLHCATDEERSALLPANRRYGGLDELMTTLNEYIAVTGRRITFEWALIDGQNDSIETARTLGRLITRYQMRRDMVHVNVIPLNPTGGYAGSPSQRHRVNDFCSTLEKEFNIACTPRVRRGIDIDAGCGQLKSKLREKATESPDVVLFEDQYQDEPLISSKSVESVESPKDVLYGDQYEDKPLGISESVESVTMPLVENAVEYDSDEFEDPEFVEEWEKDEAARLISLVNGMTIQEPPTKKPSKK